jgi:hypothetical protein
MISESELDVLESKLRAGLHKLYNSRPMECYAAMDPRGTGSVSAAGIRYGISSCRTVHVHRTVLQYSASIAYTDSVRDYSMLLAICTDISTLAYTVTIQHVAVVR